MRHHQIEQHQVGLEAHARLHGQARVGNSFHPGVSAFGQHRLEQGDVRRFVVDRDDLHFRIKRRVGQPSLIHFVRFGVHERISRYATASSELATGAHRLVDDPEKFRDIERLGKITVRAGRHQALDLAGGGVGADDDNRNVTRELVVLPQARQDFVAAQVGQMKIEQNEIGCSVAARDQVPGRLAWR